jgi:hypothetical protein
MDKSRDLHNVVMRGLDPRTHPSRRRNTVWAPYWVGAAGEARATSARVTIRVAFPPSIVTP